MLNDRPADELQHPMGQPVHGPGAQAFATRYKAARLLAYDSVVQKRNHGVFRYPAKFHQPIAHKMVELFTEAGQTVLDPFCGSGTLLVEAATLGRNAIGTDVDPLAVFVARAKTSIADLDAIRAALPGFISWLDEQRAADLTRWKTFDKDITENAYTRKLGTRLAPFVPALPRLHHWFRRRSVVQLATIRRRIRNTTEGDVATFLTLCFASILRNASNADAVPVSGLEVTHHMLAKEKAGREIDPWTLMKRAVAKSLTATDVFQADRIEEVTCTVRMADARSVNVETLGQVVDAVITSPPYLVAVAYYRRHTLEMYWLGLTENHETRLDLAAGYIGRERVPLRNMPQETEGDRAQVVADRWLPRFPAIDPVRARAFRHYCHGMAQALARMSEVVKPGGPIVVVAGDVRFCGVSVSMLELMKDLAGEGMEMSEHLWYPITNRYMSYKRNHEADIAADHVLVFRKNNLIHSHA